MFTRTKDKNEKIKNDLKILTNTHNYTFLTPGTGPHPEYVVDPHIRLQKWGGNLRNNALNIEHDLLGQTRRLNRDNVLDNNHTEHAVTSNKSFYTITTIPNVHTYLQEISMDTKENSLQASTTNHFDILDEDPQKHIFTKYAVSTRMRGY